MKTESQYNSEQAHLIEKWSPVLNTESCEVISDETKRVQTALALENQEQMGSLTEAATTAAGNAQTPDPVLISMVRRYFPKVMAYDFMGVQTMKQRTGLIYAMTAHKVDTNEAHNAGDELFVSEPDTQFTGEDPVANSTVVDPFAALYDVAGGLATADGEGDMTKEATLKIESIAVEAKTRRLKGSYTGELQHDMSRSHGMSAEAALSSIISDEIIAEQNREAARTLYKVAKLGALDTSRGSAAGVFDMQKDSFGTNIADRYKALIAAIEFEANKIGNDNGFRGIGNRILATPGVITALRLAGLLDYAGPTALAKGLNNQDFIDSTFVGTLLGKYQVHMDPMLSNDTDAVLVGYRGRAAWDAGLFYCPYVPLEKVTAVDPNSGQNIMFFKTRYGMVSNPFVTNAGGQKDGMNMEAMINPYFRKFKIGNLQNPGGGSSAVVTE